MSSLAFFGDIPLQRTDLLAPADWCDSDPGVTEPSDGKGGWMFRAYQADTSSDGYAKTVSGAGAIIAGVLINDPRQGEACKLAVIGQVQVLFGATVSGPGVALMVDANGCFIPWTSTNVKVGYSLHAQASGDIGTIMLNAFGGVA